MSKPLFVFFILNILSLYVLQIITDSKIKIPAGCHVEAVSNSQVLGIKFKNGYEGNLLAILCKTNENTPKE